MSIVLNDPLTSRAPATSQVAARLRQRIRSGDLVVGECLPPERKLAESIGVARGTIRAALQQLVSEGFIDQQGYRRRVRSIPRAESGVLSSTVGILATRRHSVVTPNASGWESFVEVGAMQQAREAGLNALILHAETLEQPGAIDQLLEHPPRGVVVCSAAYRRPGVIKLLNNVRQAGVAVVIEGDPTGGETYDRVLSDHAAGAHLLTSYLLARGRTRIVYLLPASPTQQYWVRHRLEGYRQAMSESGHPALEPIMSGPLAGNTHEQDLFDVAVMQTLGYLVDYQRRVGAFDAIMCASDGQVCQVASALRKLGLVPQKDVLITGYDNFWEDLPERKWETTLPLATADKQNMEIGRRLVRLLTDDTGPQNEPRVEMIQPRLVEVTSAS